MSEATWITRGKSIFASIRGWFAGLSRPVRVLVFGTIGAAALILAYVGWTESHEPYAPLFSQLDSEDASAVVAKLKEQKIPYKLSEHGTTSTIEVPEAKVNETRLDLAGAGLPHGGGVGFESFDKMHLGATDFEQRVLYRRALEGELSRTIGSIASIENARVHLVLPEKSVFVTRSEPASGTVVVKMRSGRTLASGEVNAVVHLMAASVPGLQPERVALVTTDGAMLHKPRKASEDGVGSDPDAQSDRQAMEASVEERVRTMLERFVGVGHADVRVSAEVDTARVEHVEDHYDPTKTALRSADETIERSGESTTMTGVPGAESNTPQGSASAATPAPATNVVRESHTRNFEIDHVSDKRVLGAGALKRVTVAVVVDGTKNAAGAVVPRDQAEIDRIAALVASAAGVDAKRGDVVTVESVPFIDEVAIAAAAEAKVAPAASPISKIPAKWMAIGGGVLALFIALAAYSVMRSRKQKKITEKQIAQLGTSPKPLELEAAPKKDSRGEAMELAAKDPATAALVLRAWLGGDQVTPPC